MDFIVQLIGFVGLFMSILAFQFKKHGQIVLCKISSEFIFAIQYLFLGAWTGAALEFLSVFRNVLFLRLVKKNRSTTPVIILFGIFVLVTGVASYSSPLSLLPIGAKLLTTVSYGLKNEKWLRIITLPSCILWVIYNLYVGSYAGAIGDSIALVSLLIAMYKFDLRGVAAQSNS